MTAGITSVIVAFDGYGDTGQIASIEARVGETNVQLPVTSIVMLDVDDDGTTSSEREVPLREAIEILCYDLLVQEHDGWETDEGAFGAFTFRVADGSIVLDFNQRVIDSQHCIHSF